MQGLKKQKQLWKGILKKSSILGWNKQFNKSSALLSLLVFVKIYCDWSHSTFNERHNGEWVKAADKLTVSATPTWPITNWRAGYMLFVLLLIFCNSPKNLYVAKWHSCQTYPLGWRLRPPLLSSVARSLTSSPSNECTYSLYFLCKNGIYPAYNVLSITSKQFGDSGLLEKTAGWIFLSQTVTTLELHRNKKSVQVKSNQNLLH